MYRLEQYFISFRPFDRVRLYNGYELRTPDDYMYRNMKIYRRVNIRYLIREDSNFSRLIYRHTKHVILFVRKSRKVYIFQLAPKKVFSPSRVNLFIYLRELFFVGMTGYCAMKFQGGTSLTCTQQVRAYQ